MTSQQVDELIRLLGIPVGKRTAAQDQRISELRETFGIGLPVKEKHMSVGTAYQFTHLPLSEVLLGSGAATEGRSKAINLSLRWSLARLLGWVYQVDISEDESGEEHRFYSLIHGAHGMVSFDESTGTGPTPSEETIQLNLVNSLPAWEQSPEEMRYLLTFLSASGAASVDMSECLRNLPNVMFPLNPEDLYVEVGIDGVGIQLSPLDAVLVGNELQYDPDSRKHTLKTPRPSILMAITACLVNGLHAVARTTHPELSDEDNLQVWMRVMRNVTPAYIVEEEIRDVECWCGSGMPTSKCSCLHGSNLATAPELLDLALRLSETRRTSGT